MSLTTDTMKAILEIARPRQWVKNGFVFAPLIFAREVTNAAAVGQTVLAFIYFCFFSSCIYIVNDIADLERDRLHPQKCKRPLPSQRMSVQQAMLAGAALLAVASIGSIALSWRFTGIGLIYLIIHFIYSFGGKSVVILDGMMVASGFVLRTYAGAVVIDVNFSDWLYICALFVSLFLAFSKRRHEIILLGENEAHNHRQILQEYSTQLLDHIITIVTAATLVTYSLYCIDTTHPEARQPGYSLITANDSSNAERVENPSRTTLQEGPSIQDGNASNTASRYNPLMKYTIPFVIYGVFRYLYLVYRKEEGGNPTELLLSDRPLLFNGLLWLAVVFGALYFGE